MTSTIVLGVIESRLVDLREQRNRLHQQLSEVDHRLQEVEFLAVQLKSIGNAIPAPAKEEPSAMEGDSGAEQLGVTAAIMRLLEECPQGLRPAELADRLEGKIATTSTNQRRLIISVADGLKKKGRLTQNLTGKLFLKAPLPSGEEDGEEISEETSEPAVEMGQREEILTIGHDG
jgi:hypothetical protein